MPDLTLTDRQRRELDYHRQHARRKASVLEDPIPDDVLTSPRRRWWNAHWEMFAFLLAQNLAHKRTLVVGCGFGHDAIQLARLGACVHAFDLSPESLDIARALAAREGVTVEFRRLAAERLDYEPGSFECVVARDILHHVDIPAAMREIARVVRPGALFVMSEVYSHRLTETIRRSRLVERTLYPFLRDFVYKGEHPYITQDERKLSDRDVDAVAAWLGAIRLRRYFNLVVNRIVPDSVHAVNALDQLVLRCLAPAAHVLAGRVLLAGTLKR